MELIKREKCAITHKPDLETLYTFQKFPVFMGCTNQEERQDLKVDMSWGISKNSGLIQLQTLLPLDVLYPESHGAGSIGALWYEHHKAFAEFIRKFDLSSVFEIGGAHGILARDYDETGKFPWTIIEPNPAPVPGCRARFIRGFFDGNFKYVEPFDAVVHSHLFEHIYDPIEFMRHLSNFIEEGKYLIFSIPNMRVMLERKYTNCINFEHTIFLTEPYVEYLLALHGFRLTAKEFFKEDHSVFYAAVRDPQVQAKQLPTELYQINKLLYQQYLDYHTKLICDINSKVYAEHRPIYLFGAHVFSQYLIAFGLDVNNIVCLLDNDPHKQDKRLYGTSLFVKSPAILHDVDSPVVILKAGVYNKEIKNDILKNINSKVEFWE